MDIIQPTPEERRRAEEAAFMAALRHVVSLRHSLSPAELAALFAEDGHLGSEMRRMLLAGEPPPRAAIAAAG